MKPLTKGEINQKKNKKTKISLELHKKNPRVDFSFNSFSGHLLNVKNGCLRHSLAAPVEEEMV